MNLNVASPDRIARLVIGLALILLPFVTGSWEIWTNSIAYWGAIVVGAVLAITGIVGFCPLYRLFGISTRRGA